MFKYQIKELREYILHLDEKIARYRKTDRDPGKLISNKVAALRTIAELEACDTITNNFERLRTDS